MAEGIMSGFASYEVLRSILTWVGYIFVGLIIAGILTVLIVMLLIVIRGVKVIEIDLVTRKIKFYNGRFKKNPQGVKMLWVGRLKKFIPKVQRKDIYLKGKKDTIILIRDNNGLHHTGRVPSYDEIKAWYWNIYEIDVTTDERLKNDIKTVYLLPNPSEDLDWLGNIHSEAKKEFASAWWQSPVVMILGTATLCVFMFIMTLILGKKL